MALTIPSQHAQMSVKIVQSTVADPYFVTMGIRQDGTPWTDGSDIQTTCAAVAAAFGIAFDGPLNLLASIQGGNFRGAVGEEQFSGQYSITTDPGITSGAPLPPNCAVLATKVTAGIVGFRSGRFYFPLMAREAEVDATGTLSATEKGVVQTACNDFMTALGTIDVQLMVLRSSSDANPLGTPSEVSALVVQDKIATQRRRLRK